MIEQEGSPILDKDTLSTYEEALAEHLLGDAPALEIRLGLQVGQYTSLLNSLDIPLYLFAVPIRKDPQVRDFNSDAAAIHTYALARLPEIYIRRIREIPFGSDISELLFLLDEQGHCIASRHNYTTLTFELLSEEETSAKAVKYFNDIFSEGAFTLSDRGKGEYFDTEKILETFQSIVGCPLPLVISYLIDVAKKSGPLGLKAMFNIAKSGERNVQFNTATTKGSRISYSAIECLGVRINTDNKDKSGRFVIGMRKNQDNTFDYIISVGRINSEGRLTYLAYIDTGALKIFDNTVKLIWSSQKLSEEEIPTLQSFFHLSNSVNEEDIQYEFERLIRGGMYTNPIA